MGRHWLWLEDQPQSNADFSEAFKSRVRVSDFTRVEDLTRQLLELRETDNTENAFSEIGLLLDVMLPSAAVFVPKEWTGQKEGRTCLTNKGGYDAGLVFYEEVILAAGGFAPSHKVLPPPVVFLTVRQTDSAPIEQRVAGIQSVWAELHSVPARSAMVGTFRKWGEPLELVELLEKWSSAT